MRLNKRAVAILLCCLLLLTLLLSSAYIVRAKNHVCCGECCLVCNMIARAERLLHGLVTLLQALLVTAAILIPCLVWRYSAAVQRVVSRTPVRWKIRLND